METAKVCGLGHMSYALKDIGSGIFETCSYAFSWSLVDFE
jgi:hypothetical protein